MAFDDVNGFIDAWRQPHARNAYEIDWTAFDAPIDHVLYIPVNRLRVIYQTEKATNWDKVAENVSKMETGATLAPVVIGYDYDVHDGHHRLEASKLMDYTHVPCIVGGTNPIEVQRATEAYQELWKSVVTDPTGGDPFEDDNPFMFRGIGQKELDFIRANNYIQSKGKGNDDDKERETCFSNLYSQAEGYARSNFDLYKEPHAYVIAVPKYRDAPEDEHGEIVVKGKIPVTPGMFIQEVYQEA